MTKVKIQDGLTIAFPRELKKAFPMEEGNYLVLEVEAGRRLILTPMPKESIVDKTAGILNGEKRDGVGFENLLRKEAEKRLSVEGIK